ncbi:hypothetical protein HOG98_05855 [bacterium]|jgi:ActR/RegA family two-component response regulator|nr:hypothetical protein [bacterium]
MTKKIILIDDDETIAEMFTYGLSKIKEKVECLVFESIPSTSFQNIHFVVTDLSLGSSSGEETLQLVRNAFPNETLIVISGTEPINLSILIDKYKINNFLEKDKILDIFMSGELPDTCDSIFLKK